MDRRTLLGKTAAVASTAALAGCAGYELADGSEIDEREQRLRNQSDRLDEYEDRIDNLEAENDDLEAENDDLEAKTDEIRRERDRLEADYEELQSEYEEVQADLERQARDHETELRELVVDGYVDRYGDALALFDQGKTEYENGLEYADGENWVESARHFAFAAAFVDGAMSLFEGVAEWTADNGDHAASTVAETSATNCSYLRDASVYYSYAFDLLEAGRGTEAEDYLADGDDLVEQFDEPASRTAFESAVD